MTVQEVQKGDVTILKVKGRLDAVLSPELEKTICEYLQNGRVKMILDLSEVNYINSAGFRMLLSVKKQVKTSFGTLIVCGIQREVFEMMKICGFDHVLEISQTEEEALRRF